MAHNLRYFSDKKKQTKNTINMYDIDIHIYIYI